MSRARRCAAGPCRRAVRGSPPTRGKKAPRAGRKGRTLPPMSDPDDLLDHNREYAKRDFAGPLPLRPARRMAVVACMDSRMPIFAILGLRPGEAHIIRN